VSAELRCPRQLDSSLDFPRPLGAPAVAPPVPWRFRCHCPACTAKHEAEASLAADALIVASGCVPPRTAAVEP